ncbi:acyl-CoA dehydrogenase [Rhodopseudomonas julia]|uniref:Acyl-coenzyme A dehydrogenase n=1 Tax=Rhodopseudomonas julia TaxID=200617 RepID=A0ABU0C1M4_9BRAD|nr:acyl-CoA dehydrogenase [Rhodopseudomonas julia]MDQ0324418.1 acyl-CoA dehydrogenase [Rhodopseudomonas julia]
MSFRARFITRPLFGWARSILPPMSDTEREAIEAGNVWWDAELFTGTPDWERLLATPPATLTEEEQAFLDGPVAELCEMLDDWHINWKLHDLPQEVWDFIREKRFFGMIIPKEYGGLGFSAFAHSEVIRKVSTASVTGAVSIMVPNSLGPGELLMQFGTKEQRDYWLPRLARGEEIPCFGLTSPDAGSDAAAMTDTGVVTRGMHEGEEVLGIRLNFSKRYITLSPIATVIGLAFKMKDPDHLLGSKEDLGITVALIPADTPGVTRGERHIPAMTFFQNGPVHGEDVFVPLSAIIGGEEQIGKGWKMLMSALAAGRGISLPSLSSAAASFAARTTGAYSRIRHQFNLPVGKFEGVQEHLAQLAGTAYQLDAARRMTCASLDQGYKSGVIAAIMKAHATYRMRESVNDAYDIHSGKAVIDGPKNYLGNLYRAVPVGITVEGANILTRNLMIYGQGAIRAHPFILKEMMALSETDRDKGIREFDEAFWGHVGHAIKNGFKAIGRGWTFGRFAPAPEEAGDLAVHYRQLSRYSSAFAVVSDLALLTLGGSLKRKERLSARLGDILSELYLLSATLKRFEVDGKPAADRPLVDYTFARGTKAIGTAFAELLDNLPSRPAAWLAKFMLFPFGARRSGPSDNLAQICAEILLEPSETRERLTSGLYLGEGQPNAAISHLERAFKLVVEVEPLRRKLREAKVKNPDEAAKKGLISEEEASRLKEAEAAADLVIAVDAFPGEAFTHGSALPDERDHAPSNAASNVHDLKRTA